MTRQGNQSRILSILQSSEVIQIRELSEALGVSRETIRKDVYELESKGLLTKVRGGAVLTRTNSETAYDLRKTTNQEAKRAIARSAAKLVQPGDTIFLDYGTTTYMLAEELFGASEITVVTNALPIVNRLVANKSITIVVPGGVIRTNENSLYGPLTARNLDHIFMTIGFFGAAGIDENAGITNQNSFESAVSTQALSKCQKVVALVDHSKFGVIAMNKVADLQDIDVVTTDHAIPPGLSAKLSDLGITARIAAEESQTETGDQTQ